MEKEKLQEYVGMLQNNPGYILDEEKLSVILAILSAYQKGVKDEFLNVGDLLPRTEDLDFRFKQIPAPFHTFVAQILSGIEFYLIGAQEYIKEFYYFNKK